MSSAEWEILPLLSVIESLTPGAIGSAGKGTCRPKNRDIVVVDRLQYTRHRIAGLQLETQAGHIIRSDTQEELKMAEVTVEAHHSNCPW
jgi:pyruvoyl-dependent arginine decarboxylase (PvlArgDC)